MKQGDLFDAAPWAHRSSEGAEWVWDDPREIHGVEVVFEEDAPEDLGLEYWRHRWPEKRLPKKQQLTGGSVGWWELGNWFAGSWKEADADVKTDQNRAAIRFRPTHEKEFPELDSFQAAYRTTFKIRLSSQGMLPRIRSLKAFTDSVMEPLLLTLLWNDNPGKAAQFLAFNGEVEALDQEGDARAFITLWKTRNEDPNTFDKTLLTVQSEPSFTVLLEDLFQGPIYLPHVGVLLVLGKEDRSFEDLVSQVHRPSSSKAFFSAIDQMPEQTWSRAWKSMVPKRKPICLPLGTDGGRHKFMLDPDGSVLFRTNDHFLVRCPGKDTDRLNLDQPEQRLSFGLPEIPSFRTLKDDVLPVGITTWEWQDLLVRQTAFVTVLEGTDPQGRPPAGDDLGVFLCRLTLENPSSKPVHARVPLRMFSRDVPHEMDVIGEELVSPEGKRLALAQTEGHGEVVKEKQDVCWRVEVTPGGAASLEIKLPYLCPTSSEMEALSVLDFDEELDSVSSYWRRRLDEGMLLHTPEPMLNEFFRAHVGHLLINCEREPKTNRRFARVGSFRYGVYGDESCMMIMDLDRRGYHQEARACLDAFLQYQGTVPLPGDYASQEGVLYGAAGYECGGYNKHHGWTLWCLAEHFRFTRDKGWLSESASKLISACDWILREASRTSDMEYAFSGLLPHGSLEDIGDWWQWLSTNAYAWKGLDEAAWALNEIQHPEGKRLQQAAKTFREAIVQVFWQARDRSPVVKMGDGTYAPHIPSHPHRRGRSFGWICETLEGAIHLLITGLIEPGSPDATWILRDYEENLYLSPLYGYETPDLDKVWFDHGGFSMQASLLFHVEPYLFRDQPKHALRGIFNAIAADYFPDVRMCCEHALPELGDWRGDHYKSSDEANAAGWLRKIFVREEGDRLLLGQMIPEDWFRTGHPIGVERAATHFGPLDFMVETDPSGLTARIAPPRLTQPKEILFRFGSLQGLIQEVQVNGVQWTDWDKQWIQLPGEVGQVIVRGLLKAG